MSKHKSKDNVSQVDTEGKRTLRPIFPLLLESRHKMKSSFLWVGLFKVKRYLDL